MSPNDIPWLLCGMFCMVPLFVGLTGFFIPYLFAKRTPTLNAYKLMKGSRKHFYFEYSLESKEDRKAAKRSEREETK